mgnify:CR=1 FL=1
MLIANISSFEVMLGMVVRCNLFKMGFIRIRLLLLSTCCSVSFELLLWLSATALVMLGVGGTTWLFSPSFERDVTAMVGCLEWLKTLVFVNKMHYAKS